MSWTSENYAKVREHLQPADAAVFDQMQADGLRLLEAAEIHGRSTAWLSRAWSRACAAAGVERVPSHILRLDYIRAQVEARHV
jgi:hypothetical protein